MGLQSQFGQYPNRGGMIFAGASFAIEGHWVLESTGKSVVFTDWNYGEPNNAGRFRSENCAFINGMMSVAMRAPG